MRSDKLFHVNQLYKVEKDFSSQIKSHQYEFCPNRVTLYHCAVLELPHFMIYLIIFRKRYLSLVLLNLLSQLWFL